MRANALTVAAVHDGAFGKGNTHRKCRPRVRSLLSLRTNYRDAFKFIQDRSLHLANTGYTMPEIGYFSENPADLRPLPPVLAGSRYVELMGGAEAVIAAGQKAYDASKYRWAAQAPAASRACRAWERCGALPPRRTRSSRSATNWRRLPDATYISAERGSSGRACRTSTAVCRNLRI